MPPKRKHKAKQGGHHAKRTKPGMSPAVFYPLLPKMHLSPPMPVQMVLTRSWQRRAECGIARPLSERIVPAALVAVDSEGEPRVSSPLNLYT